MQLKTTMIPQLGFVELVGRAERWKFSHRWPASLLKNATALILFAGLNGFGNAWENAPEHLKVLIPVLNILIFLAYFGKGSLDAGVNRIILFFSNISRYVGDFINKLTDNFLPFLINLMVIAIIITFLKFGTSLFLSVPVIPAFLREIPFVNDQTSLGTFRTFFHQLWVVPVVLKYAAILLDWMFFEHINE
jgi:hypothetical protein